MNTKYIRTYEKLCFVFYKSYFYSEIVKKVFDFDVTVCYNQLNIFNNFVTFIFWGNTYGGIHER